MRGHSHRLGTVLTGAAVIAVICCGPKSAVDATQKSAGPQYARAVCEAIKTCDCAVSGQPEWETCERDLTAIFGSWQAIAEEHGTSFDSECLRLHLKDRDTSPCEPSERCLIYNGEGETGARCSNWDASGYMSTCKQGLVCPESVGFCVEPEVFDDIEKAAFENETFLAAGQQCIDELLDAVGVCALSEGLFCDLESPIPVCATQSQLGDSCKVDNACVNDTFCEKERCVAAKAIDDVCGRDDECVSLTCINGVCVEPLPVPNFCYYLLP